MGRSIDADRLIEVLRSGFSGYFQRLYMDTIENIINAQPTVDAAPVVHGRWNKLDGNLLNIIWECSKCGCTFCNDRTDPSKTLRYCPNCGAKMDGGKR